MVVSRVIVWKELVLMIHVEQQVRSLKDGIYTKEGFTPQSIRILN